MDLTLINFNHELCLVGSMTSFNSIVASICKIFFDSLHAMFVIVSSAAMSLGHSSDGKLNHDGPLHHFSVSLRSLQVNPRVRQSAEFSFPGQ